MLPYYWPFWARPNQRTPSGDWIVWLILAGRGYGKTRTGAQWCHEQVIDNGKRRLHLVARTAGDVRDVVVEGESGILATADPAWRPTYEPSKRKLTWPNGATATTFTADQPDQLRGPQCDAAWADELAAWSNLNAQAQDNPWDQLMFGLRLGDSPQCVATTTPRPRKLIRDLVKSPTTHVTGGSTYDNFANLAPAFIQTIISKYEGTTAGRQELLGELLDELPGALWTQRRIDDTRIRPVDFKTTMQRIVVAVDPSVTSGTDSAECGIVVAGMALGEFYVLDDRSIRASPSQWASIAVEALHDWKADRIVAEVNQGGDMVEETIRNVDKSAPYTAVRASRGKLTRAEPISALYEQGRVHHVGLFPELEDQMCNYVPGDASPDRLDALVWALTELSQSAISAVAPQIGGAESAWSV